MIYIKHLSKKFGDKIVLNGADLTLDEPGKLYVLTGQSGAGKSTLFNIIFGLDHDYQGEYELFGQPSQSYTNKDWHKLRSNDLKIVFQDFKLFDQHTIYENLYLSGDYEAEEIEAVLDQMDLLGLKDELVKNISGGQKQRVAISRAVLGQPRIILLDEPTGNLDGMTTEKVMSYIEQLKEAGILLLMITHDEDLLEYADVVFELDHGKINKVEDKNKLVHNETNALTRESQGTSKKRTIRYTLTSFLRNKKKISLMGIPIIIILSLFILSFTAFQALSLDSFLAFFSGIDERTIVFDTQSLNTEKQTALTEQNIHASHDGQRLGFSEEDLDYVRGLDHVDQAELTEAGVANLADYEGNRFDERLDYEDVPSHLRSNLVQLQRGDSVTFEFQSQTMPYNMAPH